MKNQHVTSCQPMAESELRCINGGSILAAALVSGLITLLISEWDTTKKAAKDAWNGEYDPPA